MVVYLSQVESSPSAQKHETVCDFTSHSAPCFFSYDSSSPSDDQRVYMSIKCNDKLNCKARLQVIHSRLYLLDEYVAQPHRIHLSPSQDNYHLDLALPLKHSYLYYVVLIEVKQVNHAALQEGFRPALRLPKEVNATVHIYDELMIALVNSTSPGVCEKCFMPMVVQLPRGAYFEASVHRITNTTDLRLNSLFTDRVAKGSLQHYRLSDIDCNNDLRLSLSNIHGSQKHLYVNPEVAALSRWHYQWNTPYSSNAVQEDLLITASELRQVRDSLEGNRTSLSLHLAVFSYSDGLFHLRV